MDSKTFRALLFDTRSIQRYIYAGNRLRTNIGASYIVDRVFYDVLIDKVLKKMFPDDKFPTAENSAWNHLDDAVKTWDEMKSCCVAYIGGGNALILFDAAQEDKRVDVVKNFTRQLLVKRPGLKVGAAQGDLHLVDGKLNQDDIDALYVNLKNTQKTIFPSVNVPYSGLTLSCEIDGETANFCDTTNLVRPSNEIRFYSQETAVKANFAKEANENLKDRFVEIFTLKNAPVTIDAYDFPFEVDKLGQRENENYFAIVHVDGNNMGLKFRTCATLDERRKLSREIRRKTEGAFANLLVKIIQMKERDAFSDYLDLEEKFLPIRPLILGGDDVTFICPANLALIFTTTLMELMSAEAPKDTPPEYLTQKISRHMDCCAGIAILPTAYPFFRGYELAEQLCDAAKKSMRNLLPKDLDDKKVLTEADIPDGSSWLDFAILHGEQAPTLAQIRATEYSGARGNLHFGPYRVANENAEHVKDRRHNVENLLLCTTQFLNSKKNNPPAKTMAHGKIKELRGVLQHGKDDAAKFVQQLRKQNQDLPNVPDWTGYVTDDLWSAENIPQTPYVDAIELMDFYLPEVYSKWQNLT